MRWIGITFCSLLFAAAGWYCTTQLTAATPAPSARRAAASPSESAKTPLIFAGGLVEGARRESVVRTEIAGKVHAVHVREGDIVQAGDVLVELETDFGELRLRDARAQLAIATAERRRVEPEATTATRGGAARQSGSAVVPRGAVSPTGQTAAGWADGDPAAVEDVTIANARVAIAEAAVQRELIALEKTRLRAPIGGVVSRVLIEPGDIVSPAAEAELLAVIDRSTTRVRAFVEEFDAMSIAPGQPALVSAAGRPEQRYTGTIVSCAPSLRAKSHLHRKPGERMDAQVRETLIELEDGSDLILGLPVEVFIKPVRDIWARPQTSPEQGS